MNKYIGLFFCLAIVISCEHSSQLSSFDYKDLKKAPVLSLEDVFEPIKFIPLKTTESHNISNILKVGTVGKCREFLNKLIDNVMEFSYI